MQLLRVTKVVLFLFVCDFSIGVVGQILSSATSSATNDPAGKAKAKGQSGSGEQATTASIAPTTTQATTTAPATCISPNNTCTSNTSSSAYKPCCPVASWPGACNSGRCAAGIAGDHCTTATDCWSGHCFTNNMCDLGETGTYCTSPQTAQFECLSGACTQSPAGYWQCT